MKNFSVWLFYLTAPIVTVCSIFENMPPHPWFFTTQMQRLQPRPLTVIPRPTHRQDISKFFYWKHLLELECFKELCGYYKDRSGYNRPFETIGHKQMPALRNDGAGNRNHMPVFFKINGKQVQSEPKNRIRYSGNERIILWSPERNFTEKQWRAFPTRQGFDRGKISESTSEKVKENLKESTAVKDFIRSRFPINFPSRTAEATSETFLEKESPRKINPVQGSSPELFQDLGLIPFSTTAYSDDKTYNFMHRVRPSRIQPYEVEEIVEEKFLVDVDEDDKDEGSFKSVAEKNFSGINIRENEKGKTEHFQNIIDNSVNKILKGLISPVMKTPSLPDKDALPLEKHERYYSRRQQTAETAPKIAKKLFKPDARVESSRRIDLNPLFKEEYSKIFLPTDPPKKSAVTDAYDQIPLKILNTSQYRLDLPDDSGRESLPGPEKVSPIEALGNPDLLRKLMAKQPNFTPTEEINNTTQKILGSSTNAFTHSSPPIKTSHSVSESTKELLPTTEFTTTDSNCSGTIHDGALTTQDFLETMQYFSDANDVSDTEHNFIEFSDRPITFDLLTTTVKLDSEKEQETIWKSSRRMHFGHESPRSTVSNEISGTLEGEQRRSDILISDDLADYVDDENNLSTLSYWEKLKQDNSLLVAGNLTLEALIPFIPVLINDLRENKIPSEDIPMLSRALGKYWTPVLALSNFTNLDMLPLVKMKDQKDLENVLQNFLPEDKSPITAGTTESKAKVQDDYSQSYDYLDEYKDLYKDMLGQDVGDTRRRFRPRRDAEDDLKTLEATREYFDSIEEEHGDEGSDYIFEDIIYDEVSEGEDSSVFELMEVSDVHIDKEM